MQTRVPSWKRIGLQLNNRVAEARREEVPSVTAAIVPPSQVSTNRSGEGRRGKHVHGRPDRSLDGDVESLRRHEHPELVRRSGLDVDPGANDGDGGERRQVQRHQDGDDHGDRTRRHDPVVDTEGHLAGPEKRDHRNKGTKMIHGDAEGRNRSRKEKKRRDRGAKTEEPEKTAVSTKEKKLRAPGLSLEPDLIEPEDVDPTAHLDAKHDGSVLLHDVPAADQQDAAEHEHTEQVQRDGDQDREFVEEVGVHEGRREGPDQVDGDQERAEEEDEGAEHRRNSSGEKKRKRDAVEGQPARKEKKKRKHARLEEETHADTKAVADIPKAPDAFSQSARPGTKQAAVQVDAKKRVRTIEQLDETDDRGFDGTKHGQSGSNQASTNARGTQIPQEKLGASEETRSVREQDAVATTRAITAIDPSENEDVSAFAHISVMDGVNETAAHVRAFGQIDPSRTSPQISPMRKPLIPTESTNSSTATKIKRRKLTSSISSSSIHIHPALTYLLDFYHQSTSWKFAKTRQAYLLKHFFDLKIIPESYSPALRAYIVGLKGDHPRGTLLKAALEIINIAMAPRRSSGGFTAKAGAIDTHGLTEEMLEGDFSKPAAPKTSTSSSNTRARTSAAAANADPYGIDREQTEEEKAKETAAFRRSARSKDTPEDVAFFEKFTGADDSSASDADSETGRARLIASADAAAKKQVAREARRKRVADKTPKRTTTTRTTYTRATKRARTPSPINRYAPYLPAYTGRTRLLSAAVPPEKRRRVASPVPSSSPLPASSSPVAAVPSPVPSVVSVSSGSASPAPSTATEDSGSGVSDHASSEEEARREGAEKVREEVARLEEEIAGERRAWEARTRRTEARIARLTRKRARLLGELEGR